MALQQPTLAKQRAEMALMKLFLLHYCVMHKAKSFSIFTQSEHATFFTLIRSFACYVSLSSFNFIAMTQRLCTCASVLVSSEMHKWQK